MSILTLVIVLLFLAAVLWFVNVKGAAMNGTIKRIGYCKARRPSRHAAIVAIWQLL